MYLSYHNLDSKPFQITTDPNFLWLGEKHTQNLAMLKYAILENKGILTLIGDMGTGKTTLIHALIQNLGDDTLTATIYDPNVAVFEFFNIISNAFKMGKIFEDKGEFFIYFKRFLKKVREQNKNALLIIDDAHRISNELLEEIRLLLNLEDENFRVLNIFFLGQNEFIDILNKHKNKRLTQRIANRYHTEPLTLSETEGYIRHRLNIGGAGSDIFNSDAIQEIFSLSNGNPRLINIICDHALLSGYVRKIAIIDKDIIRECNKDLKISDLDRALDTNDSYDEIESKPKLTDTQHYANDFSDDRDSKSKLSDIQKDSNNSFVDIGGSKPEIPAIKQEESPEHRKTPTLIKEKGLYKRFKELIIKEKRLHKRFPAKLPIELQAITSTRERVLFGKTKDISATGAFIYTKEASYIPDDTRFILTSFYPKKNSIKLKKLKQLKNCTCTMVRSNSEGIAISFNRPVELFV